MAYNLFNLGACSLFLSLQVCIISCVYTHYRQFPHLDL